MRSDDHAKRLVLGSIAALISVGLVVGLSVLVVEYAPQRLVSTDELHGTDRAEEVGRTRTALLAFLAGVIATAGAIFTALSYRLSKRGQITERFTKAIDQLGSTSLDLQLGGIYALERIARDSKADHGPVMEVLTAYVRKRAPWRLTERPPERNGQRAASADDVGNTGQDPKPATDIQAVMTVLGRRKPGQDKFPLDLSSTKLSGLILWNLDFEGASFWEANLEGADLGGAILERADLRGSTLEHAVLEGADLREARLKDAKLEGATFTDKTKWPDDLSAEDAVARGARRICRISVSDENLRNHRLYLGRQVSFFPPDSLGKPKRTNGGGVPLTLSFTGTGDTVETDIAEDKAFRARDPIGRFFRHWRLNKGDEVVIEEKGPRSYDVRTTQPTAKAGFEDEPIRRRR